MRDYDGFSDRRVCRPVYVRVRAEKDKLAVILADLDTDREGSLPSHSNIDDATLSIITQKRIIPRVHGPATASTCPEVTAQLQKHDA